MARNLDSPLRVFINAAKAVYRKRSHGAGDRERILAINSNFPSHLSGRKGNGEQNKGRGDYGRSSLNGRGGRGRGHAQLLGYDRSPAHQQYKLRQYQQQ